jgi:hypothetical protein
VWQFGWQGECASGLVAAYRAAEAQRQQQAKELVEEIDMFA